MFQAFVKHLLRTDAILDIRFFIFEQPQGLVFRQFTLEISVKGLYDSVVGNSPNYKVKISFILSGSTFGDEVKPVFIIAVEIQDFPFCWLEIQFISVELRIFLATEKSLSVLYGLLVYRCQIKAFAKIEIVA